MSEPRHTLRPALAVSAGLHLAVLLAMLVSLRFTPPLAKPLQVVAVDVISDAQIANVKAAVQAPRRQTAATPAPAPPTPEPPSPVEAPAPPAPAPPPPAPEPRPHPRPRPRPVPAPEPEPTPAPPPPRPKPTPRPKPAPEPKPVPKPTPKPPPPKPQPKPQPNPKPKPKPDLDLESLGKTTPHHAAKPLDLADLSKSSAHEQSLDLSALTAGKGKTASRDTLDLTSLAAGGRRSTAARGAARAETDRTARQSAGQGTALDANSLSAMKAKITRLWTPECGVAVSIRVALRPDHSLAGKPTIITKGSGDVDAATIASAAQRALAAVEQGAPYTDLPPDAPRDILLRFKATDGCG